MAITKITVTNDDGTTTDFVDASTVVAPVPPTQVVELHPGETVEVKEAE